MGIVPAGPALPLPDQVIRHCRNPLIGTEDISNTMKILIAIAPEKFRDEELADPVAALQKAGIAFDIASTRRGPVRECSALRCRQPSPLRRSNPASMTGCLLSVAPVPSNTYGMMTCSYRLAKYFQESGKVVAAICLAPVVLARAGILKGKKATYFNSPVSFREMKAGGAMLVDKPVVTDMRIITANGPAAAKEFADAVIRALTAVEW